MSSVKYSDLIDGMYLINFSVLETGWLLYICLWQIKRRRILKIYRKNEILELKYCKTNYKGSKLYESFCKYIILTVELINYPTGRVNYDNKNLTRSIEESKRQIFLISETNIGLY
jgi:hypothetical protein